MQVKWLKKFLVYQSIALSISTILRELRKPNVILIRWNLFLNQCATEKQGQRQVCRAMDRGPRTLSKTADANLDCAFVETALVFVVPKIGGAPGPPL